mgnify:CR=1 FL=1
MANPIISRTTLATSAVAMSVRGVVSKTAFLLSLAAVSGFGVFFYALSFNVSSSLLYALALVTVVAGTGVGFLMH